MKSTTISIPVNREHYRVFAAAVRLIRKEHGADAPSAAGLIAFQLAHRTAVGLAKDYLDCVGDFGGRRRIGSQAGQNSGPNPLCGDRIARRKPQ